MKIATFLAPGDTVSRAGEVIDDEVLAFKEGVRVVDVLAGTHVPDRRGHRWPLANVTLLAPVPSPGTIYAAGLNYQSHVSESGLSAPETPLVFMKAPGSVAPPSGPVRKPKITQMLDYEGEMVVVIGKNGRIAGYCVANDVSARDLQIREAQWTRAKGADTFCPYGPWVTTHDEIPGPPDLHLRTWVNGELRQDGRTSDLIFDCQHLVDFISETCTLRAGDLVLTGTPGGVGEALTPPQFLQPGDVVRVEVQSLGAIEHRVE